MAIRFNRLPAQNAAIAPPVAAPTPETQAPKIRLGLIVLALVAAVVGLCIWYWNSTGITSLARVRALETRVAPAQNSRITKVLVKEGERVRAGQVLVELTSDTLEQDIALAQARLDARRAILEQLEAANGQTEATDPLKKNQAEANAAKAEQGRLMAAADAEEARAASEMRDARLKELKRLLGLGAVTRTEYEKAAQDAVLAQAKLKSAQLAARAAQEAARFSSAATNIKEQAPISPALMNMRADVKLAEMELATLRGNRGGLSLSVPTAGVVTALHRRDGEVAKLGEVVLTVTDPENVWLETFLEASDLADVIDGQRVEVQLPSSEGGGTRDGRLSLTWNEPVNEYDAITVGRRDARNTLQLGSAYRPVRITLEGDGKPLATGLRPGQMVKVRTARTH
jgi:membrane fusion protein (multidrug efflux system)